MSKIFKNCKENSSFFAQINSYKDIISLNGYDEPFDD